MTQTKDVRGDDTFDSRDVIARRDELKEERESLTPQCLLGMKCLCAMHAKGAALDTPCDANEACEVPEGDESAIDALSDWDTDNAEELADLEAFIDEAGDYGDFQHGETCVRDSYFEIYAQQLAKELGMMKDSTSWPYTCIDWKQAARELQHDYSSAELAGVTYWFRS